MSDSESKENKPKTGQPDLSIKRNAKQLIGIVAVLGTILVAWWIISRVVPGVPAPNIETLTKPASIDVKREGVTVPVGKVLTYQFPIRNDQVPGTLMGSWFSKGSSAGIKGANDDSLISFTLTDPNQKNLKSMDHPVSGNLNERITAPGTYTITFSNGGIIRSSDRKVWVDMSYQPD